MQCPKCGNPLRANARFCGFCGATIAPAVPNARPIAAPAPSEPGVVCPRCNRVNPSGSRACVYCGNSFGVAVPPPVAPLATASPGTLSGVALPHIDFGGQIVGTIGRFGIPTLLLVSLLIFVIRVAFTTPPQMSPYDRVLTIISETQGWINLSVILWIAFLVLFALWLISGLTLSKARLAVQFFCWGLLNTFFFFGQPLITPIILPILQCNHLNANTANCLFGPFMRDLTVHMPVPLFFPFAALGSFLLFSVLLGRIWCGWVCPVGLFADLLTYFRQWVLRVERWPISQALHDRLIYIKYGLLATLILFAASIGLARLADPVVGQAYLNTLPEALRYEPDCMFCPAPAIMAFWPYVLIPTIWTFAVNPDWFGRLVTLISTSWTYFTVSILFVAFSLFIPRVFCRYFCWVRAMSNLVAKFSPIALHKDVKGCTTCRTCERVCPMMVIQIMEEKEHPRIAEPECDSCLLCVESCPEANLRLLVGNKQFLPLFPGQRKMLPGQSK